MLQRRLTSAILSDLTFVMFNDVKDCVKGTFGTDVAAAIIHFTDAIVLDHQVLFGLIKVADGEGIRLLV